MTKFLDRFLDLKNEDEGTKKFIRAAVLILTIGLAGLSICGAFAKSDAGGDFMSLRWVPSVLPRVAYSMVVLGLELLAAVLFMRAMMAQDWKRAAVCLAVLPFLVWANVQNAKDGLHFIMPNTFGESSVVLNAKADLAREEAATLGTAQSAAIAGSSDELERVRTQIADLKTEQQIMASMSPEGISKAQSLLLAQGLYFGSVDGIRQDKTESAMRARGEAIQAELATLKAREDGLMAGQASPVMAANTAKRLEEITQRDKARMAAEAELRAEIIFWVAEFARNLLLWAAATTVSAAAVSNVLRRQEELAEAEHRRAMRAFDETPAPAPAPAAAPVVAAEPAPAPVVEAPAPPPPLPEPVLSDIQHRARVGGKGAQHSRAAAKAKDARLIPVGDWEERDAAARAVKIAAE